MLRLIISPFQTHAPLAASAFKRLCIELKANGGMRQMDSRNTAVFCADKGKQTKYSSKLAWLCTIGGKALE
jgi:hypothetical protein